MKNDGRIYKARPGVDYGNAMDAFMKIETPKGAIWVGGRFENPKSRQAARAIKHQLDKELDSLLRSKVKPGVYRVFTEYDRKLVKARLEAEAAERQAQQQSQEQSA